MKRVVVLLSFLFLTVAVFAHEFWLEPQKFLLTIGEKINFRIFVGENFTGEEVDFTKFEVTKFSHFTSIGEESTKGKLTE